MKDIRRIMTCVVLLLFPACGSNSPVGPRQETFPVTGQVVIDGVPTEKVVVRFHNQKQLGNESALVPSTETDKDGKFKVSSYTASDGIPEGDYVLTFFLREFDLMQMRYKGEDKLSDRYSDPQKSEIKVSVKKGQSSDLGRIALTGKKE